VRVVDLQETVEAHRGEQWRPSVRVVLRGDIKMSGVNANQNFALGARRKQDLHRIVSFEHNKLILIRSSKDE
jgi:hypothetical protein